MLTAYLLYDRFTGLDITGPHDVLSSVPGAESVFVAERPGAFASDRGALSIVAERAFDDAPEPDVVVVPGGYGTRRLLEHEPLLSWLRSVHDRASWTTSVCTGSLLLAAAGLLDGRPATTHWLARDTLASLGARVVPDRVVQDGRIITAAGVSSGIDMALRLVQLMVQLGLEYDPAPPVDAGSPDKAPPAIIDAVTAVFTAREAEVLAEP
jgi:putative intracellular protease/amidase